MNECLIIGNNVSCNKELRVHLFRCKPLRSSKSIKIEHMILDRIKDAENQNQLLQFKIMDTMVSDSSTHSSVFVWISPHTDFQPEFLNRVSIS